MTKTPGLGKRNATLDEKDWIILELLQAISRAPFAEIARQAGLSAPAAAERMRRLEDAGVITGHHAQVSPAALGLDLAAFLEVQVKRPDYQRLPGVGGLELLIGHLSQYGDTATSLILSTPLSNRKFRQGKR